jgi:hypothetical protein
VPQKLTNIAVPVRKQHTAVKAMVQPSWFNHRTRQGRGRGPVMATSLFSLASHVFPYAPNCPHCCPFGPALERKLRAAVFEIDKLDSGAILLAGIALRLKRNQQIAPWHTRKPGRGTNWARGLVQRVPAVATGHGCLGLAVRGAWKSHWQTLTRF